VTSNHYQTLGVSPAADPAAIRAAYRALMRRYHPDANSDPDAQARAREITAAFSVLGNPARRAAYDARPQTSGHSWSGIPPWLDQGSRGPPPLRSVGIAAVALAMALSITVSVWPTPEERPRRSPGPSAAAAPPAAATVSSMPPLVPPVEVNPAMEVPVAEYVDDAAPVVPQVPEQTAVDRPAPLPPAPLTLREVQQHPARGIASPASPARRTRTAASPIGTPVAGTGRPDEVDRMATGFLKQSLSYADWTKQQLLLSAQVRSRTSRKLCRSDDCVTNVYLRQMRETSAIMEGRVPGQ
jgi:hypothetical protein